MKGTHTLYIYIIYYIYTVYILDNIYIYIYVHVYTIYISSNIYIYIYIIFIIYLYVIYIYICVCCLQEVPVSLLPGMVGMLRTLIQPSASLRHSLAHESYLYYVLVRCKSPSQVTAVCQVNPALADPVTTCVSGLYAG